MYIQCTQKLLAKLKVPHGALPNPPLAMFCWHANFFEYRELLFVVMLNDDTGVDLFFPVDTFQDFTKQVVQEIELELQDRGVSAENSKSYIMEAGPLTFGPTSDRSAVARLNGYTQRMKSLIGKMYDLKDALDEEAEFDSLTDQFDDVIGTLEEIQEKRETKANGKPKAKGKKKTEPYPIVTQMVELDVELHLLGDKKVGRSFLVPLHVPFSTLHVVLQIGFGWYDSHLHEFSLKKGRVRIGSDLEDLGIGDMKGVLDEDSVMLSDYIPLVKSIEYLYDFGDSWEHTIKVGKIKNFVGEPFVLCTGGYGSTPVEDCGGAPGYEELSNILSDPTHEEYEEMVEWAGDDFDAGFDQDFINQELGELEFVLLPDNS